jgi:glycosyltransferase involved in cell wall biosynthesis
MQLGRLDYRGHTKMDARRVSVVVPTCDRPAPLRRALASIRAVEGPDLALEIIVADNGTCAETRAIASEFGAVYLKVERKGPSESRNAAMAAATGDYMCFLDDDDAWLPGHVRPHLELFESDPRLDMVIGQVVSTDEAYKPFGEPWLSEFPRSGADLLRRMLSGYFPQVGSIMVRVRVRERVGGFDPSLIGGEDLDWMLRIAADSQVAFTKTPCVLFTHRNIGTFDKLQLRRIKYDRRVFHRYALRWWFLWTSPLDYSRAYSGTLMHYYKYFSMAALERAERGERWGAITAVFHAMRVFPLRSIKHLFSDTPLRRAAGLSFSTRRRAIQLQVPFLLAFLNPHSPSDAPDEGVRIPSLDWMAAKLIEAGVPLI